MRSTIAGVVLAICACSGGQDQRQPADTLSQRERDSVIGASKLPGAAGVRRALQAADSATARRRVEDSLARAP